MAPIIQIPLNVIFLPLWVSSIPLEATWNFIPRMFEFTALMGFGYVAAAPSVITTIASLPIQFFVVVLGFEPIIVLGSIFIGTLAVVYAYNDDKKQDGSYV